MIQVAAWFGALRSRLIQTQTLNSLHEGLEALMYYVLLLALHPRGVPYSYILKTVCIINDNGKHK